MKRFGLNVCAVLALAGAAWGQDFNGDGVGDLAVGCPGEDLGVLVDAGAVTVIFGAGPGFGLEVAFPLPSVQLTQATFGFDPPEPGDMFGATMCWGDFNGDGFDDLAVGAPGEDHPLSGVPDAGMVSLFFGSPGGFFAIAGVSPNILQDPPMGPTLGDIAEPGDMLGFALASADFNVDGFDDLAIGVPDEDDPSGLIDVGIVHVVYGAPFGWMVGPGMPLIAQSLIPPWAEVLEVGDRFGAALAAGDLNGDGVGDLAIGAPTEDFPAADVDSGMVHTLYGMPGAGLTPAGPVPGETWTQDTLCVPDVTDPGDLFGTTLAIGNFDGVAGEDLAIGATLENVGAVLDCGSVIVIYSAGVGVGLEACSAPAPQAAEAWHQDSTGIFEVNATGDLIGAALAAGDFNMDGFADLAWSAPGEDIGAFPDAGCFHVIYGAGPGLGLDAFVPIPAQFWTLNSPAIPRSVAVGAAAGTSLTVGNYDGVLGMDLAFGVPLEDLGAAVDTGCVISIYGAPGFGLIGAGPVLSELWHQNIGGVPDTNEFGDAWGSDLDNDD